MPTTRRIGLARPVASGGKGTRTGAAKNPWVQFVKPYVKTAAREYKKLKHLTK